MASMSNSPGGMQAQPRVVVVTNTKQLEAALLSKDSNQKLE